MFDKNQSTFIFSPFQRFNMKQFIFKKFPNYEFNKCEEDTFVYIANIINQFSNYTIYIYQPIEQSIQLNDALLIENNKVNQNVNTCRQLNFWYEEHQKKLLCKKLLEQRFISQASLNSNQIDEYDFLEENKIQFQQFKKSHFDETYNLVRKITPVKSSQYFLMKFFCKNIQNSQFPIFYQQGLEIISFVKKLLKKTLYKKNYQLETLYDETINFLENLKQKKKYSQNIEIDGLLI